MDSKEIIFVPKFNILGKNYKRELSNSLFTIKIIS